MIELRLSLFSVKKSLEDSVAALNVDSIERKESVAGSSVQRIVLDRKLDRPGALCV